jgi:hypothetical protein
MLKALLLIVQPKTFEISPHPLPLPSGERERVRGSKVREIGVMVRRKMVFKLAARGIEGSERRER